MAAMRLVILDILIRSSMEMEMELEKAMDLMVT